MDSIIKQIVGFVIYFLKGMFTTGKQIVEDSMEVAKEHEEKGTMSGWLSEAKEKAHDLTEGVMERFPDMPRIKIERPDKEE